MGAPYPVKQIKVYVIHKLTTRCCTVSKALFCYFRDSRIPKVDQFQNHAQFSNYLKHFTSYEQI